MTTDGGERARTIAGDDVIKDYGSVNYGFSRSPDLPRRKSRDTFSSGVTGTQTESDRVPLTDEVVDDLDLHGDSEHSPADQRKTERKKARVKFINLFRFADQLDVLLLGTGSLCAVAAGTCFPVYLYYYADAITAFVVHDIYNNMYTGATNYSLSQNALNVWTFTPEEVENIFDFIYGRYFWFFLGLGLACLGLGVVQNLCWTVAGERQMRRIRTLHFQALLQHDVAWFDVNNTRAIAANSTNDMEAISAGLGQGTGSLFRFLAAWLVGFVLGFFVNWKLNLACQTTVPLFLLVAIVRAKVSLRLTQKEQQQYAAAGSVAEEAFAAIRTVAAFNGQDKEYERYKEALGDTDRTTMKKEVTDGLQMAIGLFLFITACCIAVGFGAGLYVNHQLEPGELITVFLFILFGLWCLLRMSVYTNAVTEACEAAYRTFPMIDELVATRDSIPAGLTPRSIHGAIEMRGVSFYYPARPHVKVLHDFSFRIEPGQTVALVGHTGSGKSTVAQLLERFYLPQQGSVLLDGIDTRYLDVQWLRRQIGFVGQEPVLFATTIAENIRYGDTEAGEEDIVDAAILANAHSFIQALPQGYDTFVGDAGCQLSGGQKQRIAIARALVRDPQILVLDEATSALDTAGEAIVKQAIEQAKKRRTTLVIAHRLATVIAADQIIVMNQGQITEQGSHRELIAKNGYYTRLVKQQMSILPEDKVVMKLKQVIDDNTTTRTMKTETIGVRGDDLDDTEVDEMFRVSSPIWRLCGLGRPELHLNLLGCVCAFVYGVVVVIIPLTLRQMLASFLLPPAEIRNRARLLVADVMCLAVVLFLIRVTAVLALSKASSKLYTRIRQRLFSAIIHQDMEFFDERRNRVGLLTSRLSTDAVTVRGASAVKIGYVLESLSSLVTGLTVGFVFSWKLALVVLCFVPMNIAYGFISGMYINVSSKTSESTMNISQLLQESVTNIRLVRSLTSEGVMKDRFRKKTEQLYRSKLRTGLPLSFLFSLSEASLIFIIVAVLGYGSYLVQYDHLKFYDIFGCYMAINQAAIVIGSASSYAEDFGKARKAAARVFYTLDRVPRVTDKGNKRQKEFTGRVALDNVVFSYPSRRDVSVLRGVTLVVNAGERVALVGASGCGKTTTTALLQRFYHPVSGRLLADGDDIRDLDLGWYRSQIGLVSQEPVLFDRTIGENIRYGDNSRAVTPLEVMAAAREANVHDAIMSLPQGYDTVVGNKGTQLSGGEKQRVAIARALIRHPKLLILDEATSALDARSEQKVQEALERASEGRTTIVIAHRLSTVQRCHRIVIIHEGEIVESGTHEDLVALKGVYYKLIQAQAQ